MFKRGKRRFVFLLAAIAAGIGGVVEIFSRSGTCTEFVAVAGECSLGPALSTIIVAVLLWGLAVSLVYIFGATIGEHEGEPWKMVSAETGR